MLLLGLVFNNKMSCKPLLRTIYNHVHDILRLFDGWENFPFTTSEAMRDCL